MTDMMLKIKAEITDVDRVFTGYNYTFEFESDGKRYGGNFIADKEIHNKKITIIAPLYFPDLRKEGMPICLINNFSIMTYKHERFLKTTAKVKYQKKEQKIFNFSINYIDC